MTWVLALMAIVCLYAYLGATSSEKKQAKADILLQLRAYAQSILARGDDETGDSKKPAKLRAGERLPQTWSMPQNDLKIQARYTSMKQWIKHDEIVHVQGYDLVGLIYVGAISSAYESGDSCLIDPRLEVGDPSRAQEIGYWPNYRYLDAHARARYLKWLAEGRVDPDIEIGYVFLFFYGLEKRALIDAKRGQVNIEEMRTILDEVIRLREVYAHSRSIRNYFSDFIAFLHILYFPLQKLPASVNLLDRENYELVRGQISAAMVAHKPLDSELAYAWAYHNLRQKNITTQRCEQEMRILFLLRYREQFEAGAILDAGSQAYAYEYQTASSPPYPARIGKTNLMDPVANDQVLSQITRILYGAMEDLRPYSLYLGRARSKEQKITFAALLSLPVELRHQYGGLANLKKYLKHEQTQFVSVRELYKILGTREPAKISRQELEAISEFFASMGIGIAPDMHLHHIRLGLDDQIFIYRPHQVFAASGHFQAITSVLRVAMAISSFDQQLGEHELAFLKNIISDDPHFADYEKLSLGALVRWAMENTQDHKMTKKEFSHLSSAQKELVGKVVVALASASGHMSRETVIRLEKMYQALGLDIAQLGQDIHGDDLTTVSQKDAASTYRIPEENLEQKPSKILDAMLIQIQSEETQKVQAMLINIFEEEAEITVEEAGLDGKHRDLLTKLVAKEVWSEKEIQQICQGLGLLVSGALEFLNEWSFDKLDTQLIEIDDQVYIDQEIGNELLSEQNSQ